MNRTDAHTAIVAAIEANCRRYSRIQEAQALDRATRTRERRRKEPHCYTSLASRRYEKASVLLSRIAYTRLPKLVRRAAVQAHRDIEDRTDTRWLFKGVVFAETRDRLQVELKFVSLPDYDDRLSTVACELRGPLANHMGMRRNIEALIESKRHTPFVY